MPIEQCERCRTRQANQIIHPSDQFLCQPCADYNDSCIRLQQMPDWDDFLGISQVEGTVQRQGVNVGDTDTNAGVFSLNDIVGWDQEHCADLYMRNLERISQYGTKDISDTLCKMDLPILTTIRNTLVDKAIVAFPQYRDHKVPQRKVVHKAVEDIWNLGLSITNKSLTRDTSKLFTKERGVTSEIDPQAITQMQELVQLFHDLNAKVIRHEKELKEIKKENVTLREKVTVLQGEMAPQRNSSTPSTVEVNIAPSSGPSDTEGDDFAVPRYQMKQTKRKQRRSQRNNTTQKTATSDSTSVSTQGTGQSVSPSGSQITMRESHVPQLRAAPITRDNSDTRVKEASVPSKSQATVRAAPMTRNNQPTHDSEVQVFITGAHLKSSVRQIEEHIKAMGVRSCSVQDLSRQGNDATWKSFKASVPASMKDTVLHRDNWPKGMRIRPFHPRRTNQPFRGNQHRNSRYSRPLQAANSSRNEHRHQRYDDSNQYSEQHDTYHGEQHHNGRYYDQRDGSSYRW